MATFFSTSRVACNTTVHADNVFFSYDFFFHHFRRCMGSLTEKKKKRSKQVHGLLFFIFFIMIGFQVLQVLDEYLEMLSIQKLD